MASKPSIKKPKSLVMKGAVLQLNVKSRVPGEPGLPKIAVPRIAVSEQGVGGDYNNWRAENIPGDRNQAVLLMTDEILTQLQNEGWPVQPGHMGENVTLTKIPESELGPGARLQIGNVVLEVSKACDPCKRLYSLPYIGAERGPDFLRTLVGRRGWYARVVYPGVIERGAPVELASRTSEDSNAT